MTRPSEECDQLLRIDEVKRRLGLGKTMIYRLIKRADFPAPCKLSPFTARFDLPRTISSSCDWSPA
ncbi:MULTISPECIES: AlpA family phage regulatory protein [unclassified Novosphingobium]|uniref:helix-turn-helix transcriptional regulator n=1 Tax=unclassified Novosphingobium TaxID=2644732 RepID=UPI00146BEA7C|nr:MULTISPECIES: AlpA family phage regulatory protein [unclassified Novosphingobium]